MHLKRWRLGKFNSRTGDEIPRSAPFEPERIYWTRTGAFAEAERLNVALRNIHSRWRYAVRRR